jgi:hypothetical protein
MNVYYVTAIWLGMALAATRPSREPDAPQPGT